MRKDFRNGSKRNLLYILTRILRWNKMKHLTVDRKQIHYRTKKLRWATFSSDNFFLWNKTFCSTKQNVVTFWPKFSKKKAWKAWKMIFFRFFISPFSALSFHSQSKLMGALHSPLNFDEIGSTKLPFVTFGLRPNATANLAHWKMSSWFGNQTQCGLIERYAFSNVNN